MICYLSVKMIKHMIMLGLKMTMLCVKLLEVMVITLVKSIDIVLEYLRGEEENFPGGEDTMPYN